MKKAMTAVLAAVLVCGVAQGMGSPDRAKAASDKALGALEKAKPLLQMAAAADPRATAALNVIYGVDSGTQSEPSFPNATTNWVEVLPDRTERVLTNPVFRMIIPAPVVTPIANIAATPSPTNAPAVSVTNATPSNVRAVEDL